MKSRNQAAKIVQVLTMGQGTMSIKLRKSNEKGGNETSAPGGENPGSADSGRERNDGVYGSVTGAPAAPAPIEKTVLGQPGIELLARYLQELGSIGFVVAGDLQS